MPQNCEFECEGEICLLSSQVENQAERGGALNPDLTGPSGRYWTRPVWDIFVSKSVLFAQEGNCKHLKRLRALVEKLTKEKEAAGDFVEESKNT